MLYTKANHHTYSVANPIVSKMSVRVFLVFFDQTLKIDSKLPNINGKEVRKESRREKKNSESKQQDVNEVTT